MTGWSLQQAGQVVHEGTQVLGSGKRDQLGQDLLWQTLRPVSTEAWSAVGVHRAFLKTGMTAEEAGAEANRRGGLDAMEHQTALSALGPCDLGEVTLVARGGTSEF